MSTPLIVTLIAVILLVIIVVAFAMGRRAEDASVLQRMCAGCNRGMMTDWTSCMFCGWSPASRLEFMSGPNAGQIIVLDQDVTTIGSVAGNTIVLADPAVSRKHVGIRQVNGNYEFADLGSTNGVYVNGQKLAKKTLAQGDILRVGNTELVFRRD